MTDSQYVDYIVKGHMHYWDMLGNMRGNENHKGNINRLSGDINYIYSANFNGPDYCEEVEGIVRKIKNKQIPDSLIIVPQAIPSNVDICELFLSHGGFNNIRSDCGMAKKLQVNMDFPVPPENINLFQVNEIHQLKMSGAILNTVFEYDLFSFEHYLDAFNNSSVRFYLAEYNGIPAGACMSILGDDFVEIAWVGTLNGYRKMGVAGYLINMAEKDAIDEGKSISVLSAFEMGINAYKRIGYKPYCEFNTICYYN